MALSMKTSVSGRAAAGIRRAVAPRVSGMRPLPARRVRIQAAGTDMEASMQRWENQVDEGRVVSVSGAEAGQMMKEGWTLLDVRPPGEANKVPIVGAVAVPLFIEDPGNNIGSLAAKAAYASSAGGFWTGGTHLIPNPDFLAEVQSKVPKDAKVVVACQKGLRSLAACEQLNRAGYGAGMAWINGGCDTCGKGDLPTKDGVDIRYAGIGGLSELLGWTDVQKGENKEKLGGANGVISFFVVLLVLDVMLYLYEGFQAWQQTGVFQIRFW